jgi:hypothetical protein
MSINVERTTGRARNYKFDRGGMPTDFGPFTGEIMNNVDPTRSGRVQVYIKQFAGPDKTNSKKWRTVSYCPPFGGATPKTSTSAGVGTYGSTNNQQSYGMTFSPPDIGVTVLCFFVAGDASEGFYVGCVPDQGISHMVPAIGATKNAATQNTNQSTYFANSPQLPASEINNAPQNPGINENPQFFNQPKPVHSYLASVLFQQGLINDPIRGPITSSSQRESPSTTFGISTPGRPIYQGGLNDTTILQQVSSGSVPPEAVNVVGRRGGHSFVLDDGDISGENSMIRIRTAKGHQITMSDDGNSFYVVHANGQVWLEFGQEGTLDVYATNSINLRTEGDINLHADKDFNVWAGGNINMKSSVSTTMESDGTFTCANKDVLTLFSETTIGVKSNGDLTINNLGDGAWNSSGTLNIDGDTINLNGGGAGSVDTPTGLEEYTMPDAAFDTSSGWVVTPDSLISIVSRAPTHEPYPYHNQGVQVDVNLSDGTNSVPPGAPDLPQGVSITKTA